MSRRERGVARKEVWEPIPQERFPHGQACANNPQVDFDYRPVRGIERIVRDVFTFRAYFEWTQSVYCDVADAGIQVSVDGRRT